MTNAMVEVYDKDLKKVAVLENAYGVTERQVLNGVGEFSFSLPSTDGKNEHCKPLHFVRYDGGAFYRIISSAKTRSNTEAIKYSAQHAISTLADDIIFWNDVLGGPMQDTREVIRIILSKQTVHRWDVHICEFFERAEYNTTNENLLSILFSVPEVIPEDYQWDYDFSTYPWTLSLRSFADFDSSLYDRTRKIFYVRGEKNLISSSSTRNASEICTRLLPLGSGDGVNQVTISSVSPGPPYLQSPDSIVEKYGLITKVYADRSITSAESLLKHGQAVLRRMQEEQLTQTFKLADLYALTNKEYDNPQLGDKCFFVDDDVQAYVTGVARNYDRVGEVDVEISTHPVDMASFFSALAKKQQIEQLYQQGTLQQATRTFRENLMLNETGKVPFAIPDNTTKITNVFLTIRLNPYKYYDANGGHKVGDPIGGIIFADGVHRERIGNEFSMDVTHWFSFGDGSGNSPVSTEHSVEFRTFIQAYVEIELKLQYFVKDYPVYGWESGLPTLTPL